MESAIQAEGYGGSWLKEVPELYARRAPGNTCLSALEAEYPPTRDYLNDPVNNSKGCGAIMRTAPVGLLYRVGFNAQEGTLKELDRAAAEIAALTHGHPLGYMPASVVTHIVNRLVTSGDTMTLRETVLEARSTMEELFAENPYLPELLEEIDLALELSQNQDSDLDNIHRLGEGWVAEETLGIALYCALKYQNDFSKAVAVAVNHRGDSDSTGAVTGNLLGALLGEQAIAPKWKEDLELRDVILELADDLYTGCRMSEHGTYRDDAWLDKYVYCRRPKGDTSSH
jgi:ADP-ribosylglycohydrolase